MLVAAKPRELKVISIREETRISKKVQWESRQLQLQEDQKTFPTNYEISIFDNLLIYGQLAVLLLILQMINSLDLTFCLSTVIIYQLEPRCL